MALTSAVSNWFAPLSSAGNQAGSQVATGNNTLGNTSMYNTSAHKTDASASFTHPGNVSLKDVSGTASDIPRD